MEVIFYLFLIISTWLLVKEYNYDTAKKKKLKHYLLLVLTTWFILLTLYLFHSSPSLVDAKEIRLELLFFTLFALYNAFFLIYIRMLFNNSYGFLLLLLPITYLCFLNILIFNKPSYNGAMDGFAALMDFHFMQLIVITFPVFIFAFSMTRCHNKIKGIAMFLFVATTGVLGIKQSIGHDGYLADRSGETFAFILLILAAISVHFFLSHNDTNQKLNI